MKDLTLRYSMAVKLLFLLILLSPARSAVAASDYATTRYPVVTATGFTGAPKMFGIVDYWYGFERRLKEQGNDKFYVPLLSSLAPWDIRVIQLSDAIDDILAEHQTDKVHLIGHSQGGYTVRAYAALYPEKVASLNTIGGNHRGSQIADIVWDLNGDIGGLLPGLRNAIVWVIESVMWLNGILNGEDLEQDALPTLYMSTTEGSYEFARQVSDFGFSDDCNVPGESYVSGTTVNEQGDTVSYAFPIYSWVGRGSPTNLFKSGKNLLDPSGYGMDISYLAIKHLLGGGANDGVVTTCSAALGEVISNSYYWDHLDEVNQIFGLTPKPNPVTVLITHMNRLKEQGL